MSLGSGIGAFPAREEVSAMSKRNRAASTASAVSDQVRERAGALPGGAASLASAAAVGAAEAGTRAAEVVTELAERAAERAVDVAGRAQRAAVPVLQGAAESLSGVAERAAGALGDTADRLAHSSAEQAETATIASRAKFADALQRTASAVRPRRRRRRRVLLLFAVVGTAIGVILAKLEPLRERLRRLRGHHDDEGPPASITVPPAELAAAAATAEAPMDAAISNAAVEPSDSEGPAVELPGQATSGVGEHHAAPRSASAGSDPDSSASS